ncbi:MAG: DUF354 domain-containing protein, partial [Methanobacteriaceae archaeon]|nr:DUF354 domain-containing protein [Methanobacteriaceae archaeon]
VDEIVKLALRLLLDDKKPPKIETDDLFKIIIENIYNAVNRD